MSILAPKNAAASWDVRLKDLETCGDGIIAGVLGWASCGTLHEFHELSLVDVSDSGLVTKVRPFL